MDLIELCGAIRLPAAAADRVLAFPTTPDEILCKLRNEPTWEEGRAQLRSFLGDDPDGFGTLAASLQCALGTWELYRQKGLSLDLFTATMGCFTRFVQEHMESYGRYGFDRDFWTVRQLSAVLFRVGELEYELLDGVVSLHIPSDARLEDPLLRKSVDDFRALFPAYASAPINCRSWLLSPTLKQLLPEDSRILSFQRSFDIQPLEPGQQYALWVFKDPRLAVEHYPENTSLQRRLKRYLLDGGQFLNAQGQLVSEPFSDKETKG